VATKQAPAGPVAAYPDPIAPQTDVNDYLRAQTLRVGTDFVSWASAVAQPSKARSRFTLPKVGLLSRLYLGVTVTGTGATSTGTITPAADGRAPHGLVAGLSLRVNGGSSWYDVSGYGTYLVNAAEDAQALPAIAPDTGRGTAYLDATAAVYSYLENPDDGPTTFGLEVPLCLSASNPLGMLLLQNDLTNVELEVRWSDATAFAAVTGAATFTIAADVALVAEIFDIPPADAFAAFFRPMLRWGHWHREERQDVVSTGRGANVVGLDNHDTYLKILHTYMASGMVIGNAVDALRFVLNRSTYLFDHDAATHRRRQRRAMGKDLAAWVWDFFATGTLRDAIHADAYTDIRSELDITSAPAGSYLLTAAEKLVDLGEPGAGAAVA
jgi:hypothetical protein